MKKDFFVKNLSEVCLSARKIFGSIMEIRSII